MSLEFTFYHKILITTTTTTRYNTKILLLNSTYNSNNRLGVYYGTACVGIPPYIVYSSGLLGTALV